MDSTCEKVKGDQTVTGIVVKNVKTNETREISVDGVFIDIGIVPVTALAHDIGVNVTDQGYINTDRNQQTNVPGVFAVGDVIGGLRQISAAVGEGAIAAIAAYKYIAEKTGKGKQIVVMDWGEQK
jgi:thioredoxin reductase (NADPH)